MRIYVDHAATTDIKDEVLSAMLPYLRGMYGNPSTIYQEGQKAKNAIEQAREQIALAINASRDEIFFTGSGTESDNWALKSCTSARSNAKHIITTNIEHHAVLHSCKFLERNGFSVTYLAVDEYGMISPDLIEDSITGETLMISVMFANNEIGTVMPIKAIGDIAKRRNVIFHTDAVQAIGAIQIDVNELNVDLLSISAHKCHGPKGIGALYIRKGTKISPFINGGAQERGYRAGTENVAGIVGFGKAVELAVSDISGRAERLLRLRKRAIKKIFDTIPDVRLNGHPTNRLPGNVNVSFSFIEGESMLMMLDMSGISASSGSACTSGSLDPSHVLMAIGLPHELAHGSLRLTFGEKNTIEEVDYIVGELSDIVKRLREISPLARTNG